MTPKYISLPSQASLLGGAQNTKYPKSDPSSSFHKATSLLLCAFHPGKRIYLCQKPGVPLMLPSPSLPHLNHHQIIWTHLLDTFQVLSPCLSLLRHTSPSHCHLTNRLLQSPLLGLHISSCLFPSWSPQSTPMCVTLDMMTFSSRPLKYMPLLKGEAQVPWSAL